MKNLVLLLFGCAALLARDGFVSLMPRHALEEHGTVEGAAPAEAWTLRDGVIATTGQPDGILRSRQRCRNFVLRAEWRFQPGWQPRPGRGEWPKAGFFIRAGEMKDGWPVSLEVQGYFGEAGSHFGVRGGRITGARRGPFVTDRPAFGSWDRYEITAQEGRITVVLNGVLVNQGTSAWPAEGHICLQSEGWPVYYRNIAIKELD